MIPSAATPIMITPHVLLSTHTAPATGEGRIADQVLLEPDVIPIKLKCYSFFHLFVLEIVVHLIHSS